MNPLPSTTTSTSFTVSWSGSDPAGPGIAAFNVYVSNDGGPFQSLLLGTTQTSTTFTGQLGHTYSFFSTATDMLGLAQAAPTAPQASTTLVNPPPPPPPPPVTVTSAHWETIKVKTGKGKKAKTKSEKVLDIQFSGAVSGLATSELLSFPASRPRRSGKKK